MSGRKWWKWIIVLAEAMIEGWLLLVAKPDAVCVEIDSVLRLVDKISEFLERKRKGRLSVERSVVEYAALRFLVLVYESHGAFLEDDAGFVWAAKMLITETNKASGFDGLVEKSQA